MDTRHSNDQALIESVAALQSFVGADLTSKLARIESRLQSQNVQGCAEALIDCGAETNILKAAGAVKRLAGQINVVVHSLGILLCLHHLLEEDESIQYVSLGAGNTGRPFDLETDRRVAEFKFIHWQGGPESIRQNSLFKDFYSLAEYKGPKQRFLYVLGTPHPLRFLNSGRALSSVLSKNVKMLADFQENFPQYVKVRDYYLPRKHLVSLQDVSCFVPELSEAAVAGESDL